MAIDINYVLERLSTLQIKLGGYYGIDITKLSKELGVTPRGLRKQISGWKRSIKNFVIADLQGPPFGEMRNKAQMMSQRCNIFHSQQSSIFQFYITS